MEGRTVGPPAARGRAGRPRAWDLGAGGQPEKGAGGVRTIVCVSGGKDSTALLLYALAGGRFAGAG